MCGEKFVRHDVGIPERGSPPRARGEDGVPMFWRGNYRITPACAGRSCISFKRLRPIWDHPRVCGEKLYRLLMISYARGSPPRVRGEVSIDGLGHFAIRITPACAGRRNRNGSMGGGGGDHPRVCGEKLIPEAIRTRCTGSPPRVRGEAGSRCRGAAESGITPACAGRSRPCLYRLSVR